MYSDSDEPLGTARVETWFDERRVASSVSKFRRTLRSAKRKGRRRGKERVVRWTESREKKGDERGLGDRWYGKDGPQKWKETKPRVLHPRCVYIRSYMHSLSFPSRMYIGNIRRAARTPRLCMFYAAPLLCVFHPSSLFPSFFFFLSRAVLSARVFYPASRNDL